MNIRFRTASAADAAVILELIRELAEFEGLLAEVRLTEETLRLRLAEKRVECLLAEHEGSAIGFALYYFTFSTFRGRPGLFLEDLYVRSEFRRRGVGRAFFRELAEAARIHDCFRLDWLVLDWNDKGKQFYESLGARPVSDWVLYRMMLQDNAEMDNHRKEIGS